MGLTLSAALIFALFAWIAYQLSGKFGPLATAQ